MYLNELAGDPMQWSATALRMCSTAGQPIPMSVNNRGIQINLPPGTSITVERFDLSGRVLETLYRGALKPEMTFIPFDCNRKAAALACLLRVRANGRERVIPMVKAQ